MNREQINKLHRLTSEALPLLPLYFDEATDERPELEILVEPEDDALRLRLRCYNDLLIRWPADLYLLRDGSLVQWDHDQDAFSPPVRLKWRYGDPTIDRERHLRICETFPASELVAR